MQERQLYRASGSPACPPDDRGVRPLLLALVDETFEIRCNTDHSGIIMQELLTGETDVGFILASRHRRHSTRTTLSLPIIAVACATHPLAGRQGLTLQDIANERLAPSSGVPAATS